MRVNAETVYAADADAVVALRLNPDFLIDMCRRTGALEQTVEVHPDPGGGGSTKTTRTMPTTEFPDVAKRFVGESMVMVEDVVWDAGTGSGVRTGRYQLRAEGAPVTFIATLRLSPEGSGSRELLDGEIKAKIPLVGGRIEKAIEPAVRAALDAQAEAVQEWRDR